MARPRTIDQTPTEQFDEIEHPTRTLPTTVLDETPTYRLTRSPASPHSHRRRKATWRQAWSQEVGRREFRIYAAVCVVLGQALLAVMLVMHSANPSVPQQATATVPEPTRAATRAHRAPKTLSELPVVPVRPRHSHHVSVSPSASPRPSRRHSAPPVHHRSPSPSPTKTSQSPTPSPITATATSTPTRTTQPPAATDSTTSSPSP